MNVYNNIVELKKHKPNWIKLVRETENAIFQKLETTLTELCAAAGLRLCGMPATPLTRLEMKSTFRLYRSWKRPAH